MSKGTKVVLGVALVLTVGAIGFYLFSNYLISKLDGMGGVMAPPDTTTLYDTGDLPLRFVYPVTLEPQLHTDGNAERMWKTVVLLPKGYVPLQGGEGPPAITISEYPNPEGLTLEQWVRGDARSNFKLSASQTLTPTSVASLPALSYQHSGLYETDAVAVADGDKVYVFAVGWLSAQDQQRSDFQKLLKTVTFK